MNNYAYKESQVLVDFPEVISEVSMRIAPAWPLDTAIAVNPWWQLKHKKIADVSGNLEMLGHVKCLMPKSYYLQQWGKTIQAEHLKAAALEQEFTTDINVLVSQLEDNESSLAHWHNVSDLLDGLPEHARKFKWRDEIIQQISQFCGLYFEHPGKVKDPSLEEDAFYKSWLEVTRLDKGIEVLMAEKGLHQQFMDLPDCPKLLCQMVLDEFNHPANFDQYAHALMFDIHGWASFLAYQVWQDGFSETPNSLVEELLCIRLAWEWAIWNQSKVHNPSNFQALKGKFLSQFDQLSVLDKQYYAQQKILWVWQRALELSYQSDLQNKLEAELVKSEKISSTEGNQPLMQAAFCIDVRSEPMRRALEFQNSEIETLGFAGFFGLPIEYAFNNSQYRRPQLPGLLAPAIKAVQSNHEAVTSQISNKLRFKRKQANAFDASPASLGLVEMFGLFKIGGLLKQSFWPSKPDHSINDLCDSSHFELLRDGSPLTVLELADLAAAIIKNMGLTKRFAPRVLLLGHGSCTANNPQAAGLDCGACGGQTGEVNVKVLAQLLNDSDVRNQLKNKDIIIPEGTQFIAGLHNTTTDDVVLYHNLNNPVLDRYLKQATELAQTKRAASLGLNNLNNLQASYKKRSRDWAEVRPEWGLANNASFIVAPRELTRNVDLEGRSFLHDYNWQQDHDFSVLELIMTAPMVVTNWINLQYFASVTDNRLYGSGNKLLHNVVGDHIGVFEGNGGDLRIGLSMQSLHDGKNWRHAPVRLSVYIAAPQSAIENIINKHEVLSQLVENEWLYVFQVDNETHSISRFYRSTWSRQSTLKTETNLKTLPQEAI